MMKRSTTLTLAKFLNQPLRNISSSHRSFHSNFTITNQNDHDKIDHNLVKLISTEIRKQNYSIANQSLRGLTKNWLGFYKFHDNNQLALYLHGLVLLESKNNEKAKHLQPFLLASNNGFKKAQLMLATLAYLKDSNLDKKNCRAFLEKYNKSIDWSDEKMVQLTIESYLKELVQEFDSKFAHYALGKIYLKNQNYREAFESFSLSSEKNYRKSKLELGLLMRNGSPDGIIAKNPEKALELFKKSRFEVQANKELVEMYLNGEGTNPSYSKAAFQTILYYLVKFITSKYFAALLGILTFAIIVGCLLALQLLWILLETALGAIFGVVFR